MPADNTPALQTRSIGPFIFDDGTAVSDAAFTYAIIPSIGPSEGLVILCPSLTGTPDILQAWWDDVGPAEARQRYTTLCPHAFSASTVASLSRESPPSIRDLARAIVALVRALDLPPATFVTGGSLGGMLALEVGLVSGAPTHALVIAAPAVQTAWSAGWNRIQIQAMEMGGPVHGLALARAVGMMTYRTEREFEARFGIDGTDDGRTMAGYLEHHGRRLIERFDAADYERRVRAMDTHDAGRDRGGWRAAIGAARDRITAVGIDGDALYSAEIVEQWARESGAGFERMTSIHGHDAFLLERAQMRDVIARAFRRAAVAQSAPSLSA